MPGVNGTESTTGLESQWSTNRTVTGAGNASMSIEDFYKILAAQLKYQDADNPMDTSEMMAQMVQTQMIETINQMNQISTITYASSMVGKEVTVALIDETGRSTGETKTGIVTGATLYDYPPRLVVDGERYMISQVTILGSTGETKPPDKDDAVNPPDDGSGVKPPDDEGTKPPDENDEVKPPDDGSGIKPPDDEGTKPPDESGTKPPDETGGITPPDESGNADSPETGEPPADGNSEPSV